MPVKDFILLLVYLIVLLACRFAEKTHLPTNCVSRATHIWWMDIRLKEGGNVLTLKYLDEEIKV